MNIHKQAARHFVPLRKIPTMIMTQVMAELALLGEPLQMLQLMELIERNPTPDGIVQEQGKEVLDTFRKIIGN